MGIEEGIDYQPQNSSVKRNGKDENSIGREHRSRTVVQKSQPEEQVRILIMHMEEGKNSTDWTVKLGQHHLPEGRAKGSCKP